MIVLRTKSFSKEKTKSDKDKKRGAALVAGGAIAAAGAVKGGDKISAKSGRVLMNTELTAKDKDAIKSKLIKGAKKQGIKVVNDPNMNNAAYTGSKLGTKVRNTIAAGAKFIKKATGDSSKVREGLEQIESAMDDKGLKQAYKNLGKDSVVLGKGTLAEADILSHELGHAQYEKSGRSKSVVGKAAHKLMPVSKLAMSKAGNVASFAHGVRSGMKNEKAKQEGKKTNAWQKARSVAVPAALTAPLLIAEGKASLNGLRAMKKAGASKELLKQSKKRLGAAWGTYAGGAATTVGVGGAGEAVGRGVAKLNKKKEEKK